MSGINLNLNLIFSDIEIGTVTGGLVGATGDDVGIEVTGELVGATGDDVGIEVTGELVAATGADVTGCGVVG